MKFIQLPLTCLTLLCCTATVSAQDVWIVDSNLSPGTHFQFLNDAVAAASDGDVLLIRQGTYPNPIVVDGKGLVFQLNSNLNATLSSTMIVRNLRQDQVVSLDGLGWSLPSGNALSLQDNVGAVWLQGVSLTNGSGIEISNCTSVTMIEPTLLGAGVGTRSAVTITDSSVALFLPKIRAANLNQTGAVGVTLFDSNLTIQGGFVQGGFGRSTPTTAGAGGSAIVLGGRTGGTLLNTMQVKLTGGQGGPNPAGGVGPDGMRVEQQGAGGSQVVLQGTSHSFSTASLFFAGSTALVSFAGHSNDRLFMLASTHPGALSSFAPVSGALVMNPRAQILPLGTFNNGSNLLLTSPVPPLAVGALTLYLQPIVFGSPGNRHLVFGEPAVITVLGNIF